MMLLHTCSFLLETTGNLHSRIESDIANTDFHMMSLFCAINDHLFAANQLTLRHWVEDGFLRETDRRLCDYYALEKAERVQLDLNCITFYA